MKFYMAPMESMTGYVFRNAYFKHFNNIDKYFTPFITSTGFSHKEYNDVIPEHNKGMNVVPQILTNKAEDFLVIAKKLQEFGYDTVNLNLGCPSGTMVAKGRGAGFLAFPEELDRFLDEVFRNCELKISIKTRIGMETADEWENILKIYNRYPLEELIIHPRVRRDMYKNAVNMEAFRYALDNSKATVCYNGDIHSGKDYESLMNTFGEVDRVMLGRGIFKNPGLVGELKGGDRVRPDKLRQFHDDVLYGYQEIMSGDRNTLFKMKEIWAYLGDFFEGAEKPLKKIRKSNTIVEYKAAVNEILR